LGEAHLLPLRAAAEVLLAMGEDAAAAALPDAGEETLPGQAVLLLCRGAHALAEARLAPPGDPLADPLPGAGDLLEALALAPGLLAARDRILAAAAEAADGASMPTWLGVLEQLELSLPGDVLTLSALAGYRRLHHDLEGARDLLLRARDLAEEGREEAQVLGELAALAEQEGRGEEAVQHLRAASRIDDDPLWHLRLGLLLRLREPQESARSFQRAVVLAPESPRPRLELARQLQLLGETGRAATEAARAAQLSRKDPALAQAAAELLRALMEGPR
jgi:tetratricopeptide (TPR) repeat protein